MTFPDRRTLNILCTILLFAVVLAVVYVARGVLVIFTFAILFAYLIDPVVRLRVISFTARSIRCPKTWSRLRSRCDDADFGEFVAVRLADIEEVGRAKSDSRL